MEIEFTGHKLSLWPEHVSRELEVVIGQVHGVHKVPIGARMYVS